MQTTIEEMLAAARECLSLGMKLSKQGSYARRAPDRLSLPHFNAARRLLSEILRSSPNNLDALLMMSRVSECILDFDAAAVYLCKAFEAGEPRSKKSLKRLDLLRENTKIWQDLLLTPESLSQLGSYLAANGVGPDDRTLRLTHEWLKDNVDRDPDEVLTALKRNGAFSDFQVLANIARG